MAVGFYDFQNLHNQEFKEKIKERFSEIVDSNAFIEGKYNDLFEQEFSKISKSKHCLLLANGTDALEIALQAYNIGDGDKVGIPGISFYATAECVLNRGATPVFIDVDEKTGLIDPSDIEGKDLKAIIPVHLYGMPADIKALEKFNIPIIEDGAQAVGSIYEDGSVFGSSDNLCTISFYPTKNLAAFGDAGAILTQNDSLAEDIKSIRNHGRSPQGHRLVGRNSRCDHLQAAVLHLKLETIDQYNKNRKTIAKKYHTVLSDLPIELIPEKYLELSSWHLYPVRTDKKNELKKHLDKNGIGNVLFYQKSLPEEKPIQDFPGKKVNAKRFSEQTICLPMNPFVSDEQIEEVTKVLKSFF